MSVAGGVAVDALAATDGEQGPFFPRFSPHVGRAGVVNGVGRVSEIHHCFPGGRASVSVRNAIYTSTSAWQDTAVVNL